MVVIQFHHVNFSYIFITFMVFFVRTTNTCRPTNITILQSELDIYICPRFQSCLEGGEALGIKNIMFSLVDINTTFW